MMALTLLLAQVAEAPSRLNFGEPSVKAEAYPALVDCTIAKQRDAIERLLTTREAFTRRWLDTPAAERAALGDSDVVPVPLADGRSVPANRLVVQIIETCQPLREGAPLGFAMERLYADWRRTLKANN